jgi:hypothetical protein
MKNFLMITVLLISAINSIKAEKPVKWYKGNTHCHSTVSDGDNPTYKVVQKYHDQGYNFLLVTDHNFLVNPDTIKKPAQIRNDFILIRGEEVTDRKSVHTTAFGINGYVPFYNDPQKETDLEKRREEIKTALKNTPEITKTEILQKHVDGIIKAGGIPFLNHPNFSEGLQVSDILPVKNLHHMELYNGHPGVYNWGKEGHIAVEAKWDSLLSHGQLIYAVASDDEHDLETQSPKDANPFRGWIMVKSSKLTPESIKKAVEKGDFYASNSVILKKCNVSRKSYEIEIDETSTRNELAESAGVPRIDETGTEGFTIEFIGKNGGVLAGENGIKAVYKPSVKDGYVRARVTFCKKTEKGFEKWFAWTQPVFVD